MPRGRTRGWIPMSVQCTYQIRASARLVHGSRRADGRPASVVESWWSGPASPQPRSCSRWLVIRFALAAAGHGAVRARSGRDRQRAIDIGAGFTVPTQAVFVPMLFAVPPRSCRSWWLSRSRSGAAPAILAGRVPLSRLLSVPGNSWFAVGPSLVLLVAHDQRPMVNGACCWRRLLLSSYAISRPTQYVNAYVAGSRRPSSSRRHGRCI